METLGILKRCGRDEEIFFVRCADGEAETYSDGIRKILEESPAYGRVRMRAVSDIVLSDGKAVAFFAESVNGREVFLAARGYEFLSAYADIEGK